MDIKEISRRIKKLESKILSEDETDTELKGNTVFSKINNIERRLKEIEVTEVKEFFDNYKVFNDLCENLEESTDSKGYSFVPKELKVSFIESKEDVIDKVSRHCELMKSLSSYLDIDFTKEFNEGNEKKMKAVQKKLGQNINQNKVVETKVEDVIAQYENLVDIISKKFLYYDQLIKKYEAIVDKKIMEKKRAAFKRRTGKGSATKKL